jgi:4-hydroxyphenylpyruvate dioxygenase-like putative hemolysin
MRVVVGLLVLAVCAVATQRDLRRWASDDALWTQAAETVDTPRAAVNLAVAALRRGDMETALLWDEDARARAARHPFVAVLVTLQVQRHLAWILAIDHASNVCDRPSWASWCASR